MRTPAELNLLGVSYKTAPVECREKLSIPAPALPSALDSILSMGASEVVIVSTCNRVEVYWVAEPGSPVEENLRSRWEATAGASLGDQIYTVRGEPAVQHLFRVAAGLESMVLGEPQILGQVRSAYQTALQNKATGSFLNVLFQKAIHAGKQVRTETAIASGISSVASAAVILSERIFSNLVDCGVLILGAGAMAEGAAKHFSSRKIRSLQVANRTLSKSRELAATLGGIAIPWEAALEGIPDIDIVLCSTGSPDYVINRTILKSWIETRQSRPLFLIDISVPRNIDPAAHTIENVYLYDIDDLKTVVAERRQQKESEATRAEEIVVRLASEALASRRQAHASPSWGHSYA